ncbi:hypothetical protein [Saccharopolyspora mangrovi]|uniref:Erythromycin biosynthesis protein CIII-like N-terminal domain-containing protein n=1 Tax=Saccharopolyspora mangrovi TaxID=3082379 RepID=A0ABU6AH21_9PSEU|nr:hypothetical protein [Saccharopolyspora sp. S2-29]MEB3370842.1 hypothetical protein [Saccharopolyspora sp. S2-29]
MDLGAAETLALGRTWAPDLVVSEAFDAIGPMVAAELGIAWYRAGFGPATPAVIAEIQHAATSRYRHAGLTAVAPRGYIDPCPALMQDPEWSSDVAVLPLRAQAHRRPRDMAYEPPAFHDPTKPTALVTLGTIFSDPDVLATTVDALAGHDLNVIATVGSSLTKPAAAHDPPRRPDGLEVHLVPFVPLGQLLRERRSSQSRRGERGDHHRLAISPVGLGSRGGRVRPPTSPNATNLPAQTCTTAMWLPSGSLIMNSSGAPGLLSGAESI